MAARSDKDQSGPPPGTASGGFLTIDRLSKTFDSHDGSKVEALKDISLDIAAGEFVTIVGPSGCGKSTLLHILGGVLERTSGGISIDGRAVEGPSRDVGVVFQEALLLPWRNVTNNILLPIEVLRLPVAEYRPKVEDLLRLTKLTGFEAKYPHELSGGMQQRVAIARGLVHEPSMLLMDEPFGALDAMTREQMNLDVLKIWHESKKTIILITHSVNEAVLLGDRVVVMSPRPGRIVDILDIDLPRPRTIEMSNTPEFGIYAARIRDHLFSRSPEGTDRSDGAGGQTETPT
jgi:NitT/TauT family transport system ATP-binding protein